MTQYVIILIELIIKKVNVSDRQILLNTLKLLINMLPVLSRSELLEIPYCLKPLNLIQG